MMSRFTPLLTVACVMCQMAGLCGTNTEIRAAYHEIVAQLLRPERVQVNRGMIGIFNGHQLLDRPRSIHGDRGARFSPFV